MGCERQARAASAVVVIRLMGHAAVPVAPACLPACPACLPVCLPSSLLCLLCPPEVARVGCPAGCPCCPAVPAVEVAHVGCLLCLLCLMCLLCSPEVAHVGWDDCEQDAAKAAVEPRQALQPGRQAGEGNAGCGQAGRQAGGAGPPVGGCAAPASTLYSCSSRGGGTVCLPQQQAAASPPGPGAAPTSRAPILAKASRVLRYTMPAPAEPCTCSRDLTVSGGSAGGSRAGRRRDSVATTAAACRRLGGRPAHCTASSSPCQAHCCTGTTGTKAESGCHRFACCCCCCC